MEAVTDFPFLSFKIYVEDDCSHEIKKHLLGVHDSERIGRHGIHLSPWKHQEYTFRHRSACRTPPESGQEYLTTGKEYIEPHKTQ